VSDALKSSAALRAQVSEQKKAKAEAETTDEPKTEEVKKEEDKSGKLIVAEEVGIGHVSWKSRQSFFHSSAQKALLTTIIVRMYLSSLGGLWFNVIMYPSFVLCCFFPIIENWFLGFWSSQYEIPSDQPVPVVK
jgi:hypothetical protein